MSKFSVTASELNNTVSTLVEDNNQFRARVNDLMTCANELGMLMAEQVAAELKAPPAPG